VTVVLLLCLYVVCLYVVCGGEDEKFVPTEEWQEIKEGQSIPSGLHVSLDLSTGVRKAKLVDKDAPQSTDNNLAAVHTIDPHTMERSLKDLDKETVTSKFRSIEELKKEMPNYSFKMESEVLVKLMDELANTTSVPHITIMLEELEDLAHKYDNGQLMIKHGWMDLVMSYIVHSPELYSYAARVTSAAAQSNPVVQAYCIEKGFLQVFLQRLASQSDTEAKSSVYVIGAILRNFPAGTGAFNSYAGVQILSDKLKDTQYSPLQRVTLALFNDLVRQEVNTTMTLESLYKVPTLCSTLIVLLEESSSREVFTETVTLLNYVAGSCTLGQEVKHVLSSRLQSEEEVEVRKSIESLLKH